MPYDKKPYCEDEDPELAAEAELAKLDPSFAVKSKPVTKTQSMPIKLIGSGDDVKNPATPIVAEKKSKANQAKHLRKQRQRGVSGCSSRKFSGMDMDMDYMVDYDYDEELEDDDAEMYRDAFGMSGVDLKFSRIRSSTSNLTVSSEVKIQK